MSEIFTPSIFFKKIQLLSQHAYSLFVAGQWQQSIWRDCPGQSGTSGGYELYCKSQFAYAWLCLLLPSYIFGSVRVYCIRHVHGLASSPGLFSRACAYTREKKRPGTREALFPGLDLDSGLDWTLDWTHGLWLNSAFSEARPTSRCPSYSPSPMQELDFQYKCWYLISMVSL